MYSAKTTYHLAGQATDYARLHRFFKAEAGHELARADGFPPYEKFQVSFPTVYGVRDDHVIGVMASQYHPEYGLVVSPLHVAYAIKNHVPVVIRLVDCYEAILADAGVPEYLILIPSWKPSGKKIFGDLKHGEVVGHVQKLDLYRIQVGGVS